ncbi:MAG: tetratricopeptide repeat protein [Balneolales bacterium]|nr:tetratricopeptide repeat protein [Balneolales bacterium]
MIKIPFEIPESLKSYLKTFDESPEKGIANLEQYLAKRRIDGVGFFLLAILYKLNDQGAEALQAASKARALAPGSHLLENLHYFLRHPDGFDAWVPQNNIAKPLSARKHDTASTLTVDLETLITRLSRASQKRIKITRDNNGESRGNNDHLVDELATPTLAGIYESQGKTDEAIQVYERLIELRPKQKNIYLAEISRIKETV